MLWHPRLLNQLTSKCTRQRPVILNVGQIENMKEKNWKQLVPGCFAGTRAPFGIHQNDKERAINMFHLALCQGACMAEVIKEAEKHLRKWSSSEKFITYQKGLIKSFKPNPFKNKLKKSKAWLITWEGTGVNKKKMSQYVVNIFDSRMSTQRIKDFLESYYIACHYGLFEKATYASNPSRKRNPYPAESAKFNGVRWHGQLTCGHNPFLFARIVENLVVSIDKENKETINWEELPPPVLPEK